MSLEELPEFFGIDSPTPSPPSREEIATICGRVFDLDSIEDLAIIERNLDLLDIAHEKSAGRVDQFPVSGSVVLDRDTFRQITILAREAIVARRSKT